MNLPPATRFASLPGVGRHTLALAALAAGVTIAAAVPAKAATYKWVDEKGVVHYTDKIPTEAVNKGSTVLDKQARPLKKIDPALTPEQIRAREAEEERKRNLARTQEELGRRDRALLASYTTEAEIDLAQTRALGTIDSQIESSRSYTALLLKKKEDLNKRRVALGDKPLPVALEREIEGTESELGKQAVLIGQKQRERAVVVAKYEADKVRYRELRAVAEAEANAAAAAASAAKPHPATLSPTSSTASSK